MIVELKEKLKPNTFLFWDGAKLIPVSREELLNDVTKRIQKLEDFHQSILSQQKKYEDKMNGRFKKFLSIFKRGDQ